MDKIKKLANDVKKLSAELAVCTRCGMCQANCPLFAQTHKEADVSRGKLVLINGLIEQMFDDPKGVNERLKRCLLCGSCSHGCPSRVNTVEIFLKARGIIAQYIGLPFSKKIIFPESQQLGNEQQWHLSATARAAFIGYDATGIISSFEFDAYA